MIGIRLFELGKDSSRVSRHSGVVVSFCHLYISLIHLVTAACVRGFGKSVVNMTTLNAIWMLVFDFDRRLSYLANLVTSSPPSARQLTSFLAQT